MAIHIPLTLKAQAETRTLMISTNNCNLPSNGKPNLLLSQDMILGCYALTIESNKLYYLLKKIVSVQCVLTIKYIIKNKFLTFYFYTQHY